MSNLQDPYCQNEIRHIQQQYEYEMKRRQEAYYSNAIYPFTQQELQTLTTKPTKKLLLLCKLDHTKN